MIQMTLAIGREGNCVQSVDYYENVIDQVLEVTRSIGREVVCH